MSFQPRDSSKLRYRVKVPCPPALLQYVPGKPRIAGCFGIWLVVPDQTKYEDLSRFFEVVGWGYSIPEVVKVQPSFITVQGSKGSTYVVRRAESGRVSCSCPGFGYRGACKHTKLLPA